MVFIATLVGVLNAREADAGILSFDLSAFQETSTAHAGRVISGNIYSSGYARLNRSAKSDLRAQQTVAVTY